jgi:hypothetical protein
MQVDQLIPSIPSIPPSPPQWVQERIGVKESNREKVGESDDANRQRKKKRREREAKGRANENKRPNFVLSYPSIPLFILLSILLPSSISPSISPATHSAITQN